MKKSILLLLGLLVITSASCSVFAKSQTGAEVMHGVKLYRAGNYVECYSKMNEVVEKEPANALAYYYLAMSATQVGKKDVALANYEKVIALSGLDSNIGRYAYKGKICLEAPDKCDKVSVDGEGFDSFVINRNMLKFSEKAKKQYENLKIENLKREINRKDSIEPNRFKEYKDFSSMNIEEGIPSNDEIVAALKTLQRAGLGNVINNGYSDISMLTGVTQQNPMYSMMGNQSLSPQMIQALFTNSISQGF